MKQRIAILVIVLSAVITFACGTSTPPTPQVFNPICDPADLVSAVKSAGATAGPAVINLAPDCDYRFSTPDNTQTIQGVQIDSALPMITDEVSLVGNNAFLTVDMGTWVFELGHFNIQPNGYLHLENLTVRGGVRYHGGAVYVNERGSLYAEGVIFQDNLASGSEVDEDGSGGAIYADRGKVTIIDGSQFIDNHSFFGGAVYALNSYLLVSNSTFSDNSGFLYGGAISVFRTNRAEGFAGTVISGSTFSSNYSQQGGAVYAEGETTTFLISTTDFSSNEGRGGGVMIRDSILDLSYGEFTNNSAGSCGALGNFGDSELTVSHVTFRGNTATYYGGALCQNGGTLSVAGSQFLSNIAHEYGGGIFATRPFSVEDTTFDANRASIGGGGVFTDSSAGISGSVFSNNQAYRGGGMYAGEHPDYPGKPGILLAVSQSTFDSNETIPRQGVWDEAGGGIFFAGEQLDLQQSTVSRNRSAKGAGVFAAAGLTNLVNSTLSMNYGGPALESTAAAELNLLHVTIMDNQPPSAGASLVAPGPTTIKNSIVHGGISGVSCRFSGPGPLTVLGENLDRDGSCTGFTLTVNNPYVLPLADNGGPTQTNALTNASPAVNAALTCGGLTVDQRGETRPFGWGCDLGAFEWNDRLPSVPAPTEETGPAGRSAVTPEIAPTHTATPGGRRGD